MLRMCSTAAADININVPGLEAVFFQNVYNDLFSEGHLTVYMGKLHKYGSIVENTFLKKLGIFIKHADFCRRGTGVYNKKLHFIPAF